MGRERRLECLRGETQQPFGALAPWLSAAGTFRVERLLNRGQRVDGCVRGRAVVSVGGRPDVSLARAGS